MQLADLMLLARRFVMSVGASPAYPNGRRCYSGVYHDGRAVYFYDDSGNGRIYGGKFWFSRMTYVQSKGQSRRRRMDCSATAGNKGAGCLLTGLSG